MTLTNNKKGFTLFELMISMVIFWLIMITVLESVANITIARTKSMNRVTLLEELYYFSESLATKIKDGGTIDYEEYWNRKVVGTAATSSGHFSQFTGYGNYGKDGTGTNYGGGYYYCRSGGGGYTVGNLVGSGGCLDLALNSAWVDQSGAMQRYGQYHLQYMDYNGNGDNDTLLGDEDGNGDIVGDEDDRDIGDGPEVISSSIPELYLYDPITKERTFFRWVFQTDTGSTSICDTSTGSGCLGNIQVLKLKGFDVGMWHTGSITETGSAFDGKIDTWACHFDWKCHGASVPGGGNLPNGINDGWENMFPEYINVKKIRFNIYPLKDPWRAWGAPDASLPTDISPFIQPYVRMDLTLGLSWDKRKLIRGDDPTISVSTTISLGNSESADK